MYFSSHPDYVCLFKRGLSLSSAGFQVEFLAAVKVPFFVLLKVPTFQQLTFWNYPLEPLLVGQRNMG